MQIVIQNLPQDVSEDEIREALRPFTSAENPVKIALIKEGGKPTALIDMETSRVGAGALAARIDGHIYKGQRLHAWVPLFDS
jgi:hypothetical protein